MSTVLDQIEQQIAKLSTKAVKKNTGNIRTIADYRQLQRALQLAARRGSTSPW